MNFGANAKIIRRTIGDFANAWGFGIDAAAQYNWKGYQFGVVVKDVTSTFNAWSFNLTPEMKDVFIETGNEIPSNSLELTLPRCILGVAKKSHWIKRKIFSTRRNKFNKHI